MRVWMLCFLVLMCPGMAGAQGYEVWVSNERSGEVTIIDGERREGVATVEVGKRPRGIHAAPDGERVYVAVSGTPIGGPPAGAGVKGATEEDEPALPSDHAADGIAVVEVGGRKVVGKLGAGSDPENFAVGSDGKKLFVANEDVGTASVVDLAAGKVTQIVQTQKEPEGVEVSPDGKRVYVTCEAEGAVVVMDAERGRKVGEFRVEGRPRSVAFDGDGKRAYVPSETTGVVHVVEVSGDAWKAVGKVGLPEGARPMRVLMMPGGKRLLVSTGRGGTVCVVNVEKLMVEKVVKVGARPWGMAVAPDGKTVWVANGPSDDVSVVDVEAGQEVARVKVGKGPWGVAVVERK